MSYRLLSAIVVATLVAGCSGDDSAPQPVAGPTSASDLAAHTPTDLRHPCDAVSGAAATKVLHVHVTAKRVGRAATSRTLDCSYLPPNPAALLLEIRSTPDPRALDPIVGLYLGVDRLQHHPVRVSGADAAQLILGPGDRPTVTVLAKQGFVTHTVVLRLPDPATAERDAVRLMAELVAANR